MNQKDKIIAYLKSGRRGKAANSLERDAMDDAFLNDALEGFANSYIKEQPITNFKLNRKSELNAKTVCCENEIAAEESFVNNVSDNDINIDNSKLLLVDIDRLQQLIEKKSKKKTSQKSLRWITSAAAVLLVFITGYRVFYDDAKKANVAILETISSKTENTDESNVYKDYPADKTVKQDNKKELESENIATELKDLNINDVSKQKQADKSRQANRKTEEKIKIAKPIVAEEIAEDSYLNADIAKQIVAVEQKEANKQVAAEKQKETATYNRSTTQTPIQTQTSQTSQTQADTKKDNNSGNTGALNKNENSIFAQNAAPLNQQIATNSDPFAANFAESNYNANVLNEVVVIGYGTTKKVAVAGSVAAVKAEEIAKSPTKTVEVSIPYPSSGMELYSKYLKEELCYPADAKEEKLEGKVVLNFAINKNGRPKDIRIEQSLGKSCDKEAVRLLKEGCDWKPSVGDPHKRATLTVEFKL